MRLDPDLSQIQFRFDPHYDPLALDFKNQQLCSYCPVFRKTPVKVDLLLSVGMPSELINEVCPGATAMVTEYSWLLGFSTFYPGGEVADWGLKNQPDLFAEKTESRTMTFGGFPTTENSDFKLKPCTGQPQTGADGQMTCTAGSGGTSTSREGKH